MQNICIRVAIERRLLHVIADNTEPISSRELARATNTDELLIGKDIYPSWSHYILMILVRVMRVLTAIGLANETANQTYTGNDTTRFEILPGSIAAIKHQ